MIKRFSKWAAGLVIVFVTLVWQTPAQIPVATQVAILKAEDSRTYDATLETLIKTPGDLVRKRAALAAGRIGDDRAVPALVDLLTSDIDVDARAMAAFALGEIESIKGADAILKLLMDTKTADPVRARAVEAAGKIASANPLAKRSVDLADGIVDTLRSEHARGAAQHRETVLLAITAALRLKPDRVDDAVEKFLGNADARIRADAANVLARHRSKKANAALRSMLANDADADARGNAARALGAAEDNESIERLAAVATDDSDVRVRVSAIRAVAASRDAKAFARLLERGEKLLDLHSKSKLRTPDEKSELLEIATAMGRMVPSSENQKAVIFLNRVRMEDSFRSPETEIALARVAPEAYVAANLPADIAYGDWRIASAYGQGMAELATAKNATLKKHAGQKLTAYIAGMATGVKPAMQGKMMMAMPDLMRGMAALKPDNLDEILRGLLQNDDVFIRAAAAELLAEQPVKPENVAAISKAAAMATVIDRFYNDAQLAIMEAYFKLDRKGSLGVVLGNLNARDYLVRKKAFELLKAVDIKESPGVPSFIESAVEKKMDKVLPYEPVFGTKLGQVLNTDADYRRAVSRRNGSTKAVLTTEKGTFTIDLLPEDAPLTVDNFIKLANRRYFNGLEIHRVVPNFVMQDGDPRGDGNGGPGWSIRCEINTVPYDRGAVGMALSGKDTGGSQWFVTHSPQSHLDGGYTVFGHVNEADMKVVDRLVRGDRVLSVRIVEGNMTPKRGAAVKKKASR